MFRIVEIEEKEERGNYRLTLETDDTSLFELVSMFDGLKEFSSFFRHKVKTSRNIIRAVERAKAQKGQPHLEYHEMLDVYNSLNGYSPKEKIHFIANMMREKGHERITQDGVMAMLSIAREERKKSA